MEESNKLNGLKIEKLNGEEIELQSLWKVRPIVLMVPRRCGCILTRHEASIVSKLKPKLDEMNVGLVAVEFDKEGMEEFQKGEYFKGEIYLDEKRNVHKALDLFSVGMFNIIYTILFGKFREYNSQSKTMNLEGNLKGDGYQLGGIFVIGKGNEGILYEFRQNNFADYAPLDEVVKALGGDPSVVQEILNTKPIEA